MVTGLRSASAMMSPDFRERSLVEYLVIWRHSSIAVIYNNAVYAARGYGGLARRTMEDRQHRKRTRDMASDLIRTSISDGIAELMLDRAPVNALSMPLIDALLAALAKARDDEAVRAVIVGSAHKVFCAGLDLDIVRGKPAIETKKFLERLYFALNDTQYRMGKPT